MLYDLLLYKNPPITIVKGGLKISHFNITLYFSVSVTICLSELGANTLNQ